MEFLSCGIMSILKELQILIHFRFGDLQIRGRSVCYVCYYFCYDVGYYSASEGALSSERTGQVLFPLGCS